MTIHSVIGGEDFEGLVEAISHSGLRGPAAALVLRFEEGVEKQGATRPYPLCQVVGIPQLVLGGKTMVTTDVQS